MSWETLHLGEFLTLKRGYDLPSSKREEGTVPVVSSSGVTGYHNVAKMKGPGLPDAPLAVLRNRRRSLTGTTAEELASDPQRPPTLHLGG